MGNESGTNNPRSWARPRITAERKEIDFCVGHPRVDEYVIDFFEDDIILFCFLLLQYVA